MSTLTFEIPKQLWLTANRHGTDRAYRARIVRGLHDLAATTAMVARLAPVTGLVDATWLIRYPKGVRLDKGEASNAQPTTKALLDGLTPRWLPDDGPEYVRRETFERGPNLTVPSLHTVTLTLAGAG